MFICHKLVMLIASQLALSSAFFDDIDFCSVRSCEPKQHVMCMYSKPGGDTICGIGHKPYPLTERQKSNLLDWHNDLRLRVAMGHYPGAFPKPVGNMHELTWNPELERYAQRWADQCNTVLARTHDTCRNTISSDMSRPVGQNVFSSVFATESETIDSSLEKLKLLWSRGPLTDPLATEMSPDSSPMLQVVWPSANALGCAQTHFTNGTHRMALVVCNYGARKYGTPGPRLGPSCSECPGTSVCSNVYPGLCSAATQSRCGLLAVVVLCASSIQWG